jgi:hypothetical protein
MVELARDERARRKGLSCKLRRLRKDSNSILPVTGMLTIRDLRCLRIVEQASAARGQA